MISKKDISNKDYITRIAESKTEYHRQKANMPFEEKFKILIELQKLDHEMTKNNKKRKISDKLRFVWRISEEGTE
jgi:CO dehydrogenase/acetyl-CoA synthase alpha subunit